MKSSGRKRSYYDIYADILKCCLRKIGPTKVMKEINHNYANTKKYLALLIDLGFIEKNSTEYITTSKGLEFLEKYNVLNDLLVGDSCVSLKDISLIRKKRKVEGLGENWKDLEISIESP